MAGDTARRERKVVTVIFCDLVGFTAQAESLDPEDVEAILRPYHERVRSELERHGGTVEKFIGDAVMALFGAPTAHEDDPERAVRAALAIREFALEEGLELRVGITTGEALVSLDARPDEGEGMASGDVVNTAARLQSAAPVNGVLVDETTYRATRAAIDFDVADPVAAKGKAEPISVWTATAAHSRFGVDVTHHARTELVGREQELGFLRDAFLRARSTRTPQLVTLVAVPGMGKSRLIHELLTQVIQPDPELVTWRQGRCLAYGDGIAFWALADVVKAQAGIAESDAEEEAASKLHAAVADALSDESEARWVESHLRPLVGLETQAGGVGGDRSGEAFAAWRRFLEALGEQRPLVLVLEDIHWADDGLLEFVDELLDRLSGIPLLVVCTARPELLERRPGWGGGKLNASTIGLQPLEPAQTGLLISRVLERTVLPVETRDALLARSEGNPLYAEQFAQLYLERGSTDLDLPETLQGIIAARLDGLALDEKALLQDASVVGKVFWTGALRRDADATETLYGLERKAFLTRQRRSSVENEAEWSFSHMLLRDVAYAQIPRAHRASRHRETAEWLETLGRSEDYAEMLAHHWKHALDLTRAAGGDTAPLVAPTHAAFGGAGDRAYAVHAHSAAIRYYDEALELMPEGEHGGEMLFRRAQALAITGDERAVPALEEARDALIAAGRRSEAAEAEAFLAQVHWLRGEQHHVFPRLHSAEGLIEGADPSPAVAWVLAWSARYQMLAGQDSGGLERATEAYALADGLDFDEVRIHALTTIGSAKENLGDETGRHDLERAVELGRAAGSPLTSGALNNLAVVLDSTDARRVKIVQQESLEEAERYGDARLARFARGNLVASCWWLGHWDEAMTRADDFVAECEDGSPHILEGPTRLFRAYISFARGHHDRAFQDFCRALGDRATSDAYHVAPAHIRHAWALLHVGRRQAATDEFAKGLELIHENPNARVWVMAEVAYDLGETTGARAALSRLPPRPGIRAMLAVLDGDFASASELYGEAGIALFEAEARLRWAEQLFESGRAAEGHVQLERALAFYRPIGATMFVERGAALLAKIA